MPKKQSKISVVALSPKTKKPLRVIKKNQAVIYGVRGPKGGIKVLSPVPQKFFKTDLKALDRAISNTDGKSFVIHKQVFSRTDKDGKTKYIIDPLTKKPKVKITGAKPSRKQKPVLYVKGRPVRDLDIGYKKGNYAIAREMRKLTIVKPDITPPIAFALKGDTIKQALSSLQVDLRFKELMSGKRRLNLYYNIILKVIEPNGEVKIIPVNGAAVVDGFPTSGEHYDDEQKKMLPREDNSMVLNGKLTSCVTNVVHRISNLKTELAFALRRALKDGGYRFTSPAKLKQISSWPDRQSFNELQNIGRPSGDLKQVTGKYKVIVYIQFEVM